MTSCTMNIGSGDDLTDGDITPADAGCWKRSVAWCGNSQPIYKNKLEFLRPYIESCHEYVYCHMSQLQRKEIPTEHSTNFTLLKIDKCRFRLKEILNSSNISIDAYQRAGLRDTRASLHCLRDMINALNHDHTQPDISDKPDHRRVSFSIGNGLLRKLSTKSDEPEHSAGDFLHPHRQLGYRNPACACSMPQLRPLGHMPNREVFVVPDTSAELMRSVVEQCQASIKIMKVLLVWVDRMLERKWWLKEIVRLARTLILLAVFISASAAVLMPSLAGPIVTLSLTIATGVLDIIDKVFVKKMQPDKIRANGEPMPA